MQPPYDDTVGNCQNFVAECGIITVSKMIYCSPLTVAEIITAGFAYTVILSDNNVEMSFYCTTLCI